ncbi:MAG: C39 family peptidase [Candidatus Paceibacterota bacterium]
MKITKIILIFIILTASFYVVFNNFVFNKIQEESSYSLEGFTPAPTSPTPETTATRTPRPTITPQPSRTPGVTDSYVLHGVPFTPQAPFGEWNDPRQADACEESSAIMAMAWARGDTSFTLEDAKTKIIAISEYELANHGSFTDTSAFDTVERIFKGYFGYNNVELRYDISIADIKEALFDGHLVMVPANGQKLGNPYFTPPGPLRHMLVIRGYDVSQKQFLTNDPGTRRGELYAYSENVLFEAIRDYATGDHIPIPPERTAMIVIKKSVL